MSKCSSRCNPRDGQGEVRCQKDQGHAKAHVHNRRNAQGQTMAIIMWGGVQKRPTVGNAVRGIIKPPVKNEASELKKMYLVLGYKWCEQHGGPFPMACRAVNQVISEESARIRHGRSGIPLKKREKQKKFRSGFAGCRHGVDPDGEAQNDELRRAWEKDDVRL